MLKIRKKECRENRITKRCIKNGFEPKYPTNYFKYLNSVEVYTVTVVLSKPIILHDIKKNKDWLLLFCIVKKKFTVATINHRSLIFDYFHNL